MRNGRDKLLLFDMLLHFAIKAMASASCQCHVGATTIGPEGPVSGHRLTGQIETQNRKCIGPLQLLPVIWPIYNSSAIGSGSNGPQRN